MDPDPRILVGFDQSFVSLGKIVIFLSLNLLENISDVLKREKIIFIFFLCSYVIKPLAIFLEFNSCKKGKFTKKSFVPLR